MSMVGTVARGIRGPIIRSGDDLVSIVVDSVLSAGEEGGFSLRDRDVVAVTEAVVARSQGNYATLAQIATDVRQKFPSGTVGMVFPILSRNRFSLLLKGIAQGVDHLVVQLAYPSDEVGNPLVSIEECDRKGIDPGRDNLSYDEFVATFGRVEHPFTGINYPEYYRQLGSNITVTFSNDPRAILKETDNVICADIHTRARTKRRLLTAGAKKVYGLDEILVQSVDGSGFNEDYGLLGSNMATPDKVKLFPRSVPSQAFVLAVQEAIKVRTGKTVEVMVYGDGAFKDPIGGIWELADPVVSPAYTSGLEGTPSELKLKYLADNEFGELSAEAAKEKMIAYIQDSKAQQVGGHLSEGTTPRRLTDLLGSLSDLTSGSGDKGTPFVLVQGYFDNYAT